MSRAIGGYVRRCERMQPQPDPDYWLTHCGHCGANLRYSMLPHICKEITYQSMPLLNFEPFVAFDGGEPLDSQGMPGIGWTHGQSTGHHPDRT